MADKSERVINMDIWGHMLNNMQLLHRQALLDQIEEARAELEFMQREAARQQEEHAKERAKKLEKFNNFHKIIDATKELSDPYVKETFLAKTQLTETQLKELGIVSEKNNEGKDIYTKASIGTAISGYISSLLS